MKQVPQKDAPLKLNNSGTWIREDVSYEVNEPDAFALEERYAKRKSIAAKWWQLQPVRHAHRRCCGRRWLKARTGPSISRIMPLSASTRTTRPERSRRVSRMRRST